MGGQGAAIFVGQAWRAWCPAGQSRGGLVVAVRATKQTAKAQTLLLPYNPWPWHGPPSGHIWSQKGAPFGRLRTPFFARIWAPPTPPTGPLIIRQIGENLPTPLQLWCFLVDVFLKKAYPPGTPFFGQKTTPQNIPKAPEILAKIPPPSNHFFPNL